MTFVRSSQIESLEKQLAALPALPVASEVESSADKAARLAFSQFALEHSAAVDLLWKRKDPDPGELDQTLAVGKFVRIEKPGDQHHGKEGWIVEIGKTRRISHCCKFAAQTRILLFPFSECVLIPRLDYRYQHGRRGGPPTERNPSAVPDCEDFGSGDHRDRKPPRWAPRKFTPGQTVCAVSCTGTRSEAGVSEP